MPFAATQPSCVPVHKCLTGCVTASTAVAVTVVTSYGPATRNATACMTQLAEPSIPAVAAKVPVVLANWSTAMSSSDRRDDARCETVGTAHEHARGHAGAEDHFARGGRCEVAAARGRPTPGRGRSGVERVHGIDAAVLRGAHIDEWNCTRELNRDDVRARGGCVDVLGVVDRLAQRRTTGERRSKLVHVPRTVGHRGDCRRGIVEADSDDVEVARALRLEIGHGNDTLTRLRRRRVDLHELGAASGSTGL